MGSVRRKRGCEAGRPNIGMLVGEGADVIQSVGADMVCFAGDSAGLDETIQRFAETSQEEQRQTGEQGQAYARAEFDRNIVVSRLLNLREESIRRHQQENRKVQ